jgi:hypothetical protein
MDSSKRAMVQQFIGEVVANLKLDQFAATFRAYNPTGAIFADFPSFCFFRHNCVSFLLVALGNPRGFSLGRVKLLQAACIVNYYF